MTDLRQFGIHKGEGKYHEEIIYSLAFLYNIISRNIEQYLRPFGLSLGKWNILLVIQHQGGEKGMPQVEISKHLIVTPSNMTKMIDKLEQEGLVARSSLDGDRRVNMIKVTQKGKTVIEAAWPGYEDRMKQAVACLQEDRQRRLAGLLTGWLAKVV